MLKGAERSKAMLTSFTCDWLTIPSLGQFNLITGRNGVGKTRLLKEICKSNLGVCLSNWGVGFDFDYPDEDGLYLQESLTEQGLRVNHARLIGIMDRRQNILLIDQVDLNLHYTSVKPMWEKLLGDAHKYGIQVFATTHSEDCVRYFSEVASEQGYDVRLINLHKPDDLPLMASVYDTQALEVVVTAGIALT